MARSFFDTSLLNQMMPQQGLGASPVFDIKMLLETQRKNIQAMSDAMRLGFEGMQQAAARQAELIGRAVQDNSSFASSLMTDGTPEQKVRHQADLMRKSYEESIRNAQELGDILARSQGEAAGIINRRVSASLNEFKAAFEHGAAAAADAGEAAVNAGTQAAREAAKAPAKAAKSARKATRRKPAKRKAA